MMTSPDAFFVFSKFWFSGLLGGGGRRGGRAHVEVKRNDKLSIITSLESL